MGEQPWAILIGRDLTAHDVGSTELHYTIYSEDIEGEHSMYFTDAGIHTISGRVEKIVEKLKRFATVTDEDREHLELRLIDIITHW